MNDISISAIHIRHRLGVALQRIKQSSSSSLPSKDVVMIARIVALDAPELDLDALDQTFARLKKVID